MMDGPYVGTMTAYGESLKYSLFVFWGLSYGFGGRFIKGLWFRVQNMLILTRFMTLAFSTKSFIILSLH